MMSQLSDKPNLSEIAAELAPGCLLGVVIGFVIGLAAMYLFLVHIGLLT